MSSSMCIENTSLRELSTPLDSLEGDDYRIPVTICTNLSSIVHFATSECIVRLHTCEEVMGLIFWLVQVHY